MGLDFGVLGPIEVRRDGTQISIGGRQQRRVLATLIADAGRVVPIERLVDAVWPDGAPDGARRTVMTYISRLRLALGDAHVVTQDPGYRFATADESIDAIRFERLVARAAYSPPTEAIALIETALGLWRGEAFGEFSTEWWALRHGARLQELRLVASEQRAESLLNVGDDRVVPELEALVVTYPLRERFISQLMRAYDRSGRQADALRAYNAYRSDLAEQTGLDPSATLRQLESEIVSGRTPADDSTTRARRGYVLGEVLGAGAYGTVYRSAQPGVGREVAVKVIRSELADDPGFVGRFEVEAQLVAHLEHPHIVPLYDFWREPGGAYLVFRLLRGGSGRDLLARDGAVSLDRVDRLVTEVGDALQAAHAAGVVHRDVKAANVLFDEAGNAYLTDFGIAATTRDRVRSRVRGPVSTEPRDDQYSFAAMIWELLAGVQPVDAASTSAVLNRVGLRPVGPLPAHCADIGGGLTAVLQRATASEPGDRFDDIADLLTAWRSARHARDVRVDALAVARQETNRQDQAGAVLPGRQLANPYVGLRAFGEADARHFHGRAALTARLAKSVLDRRFLAVVGASGSGKSSLLFAGLVPQLRAAGVRVASMVPGDNPLAHLELALRAVAVEDFDNAGVAEMVGAVGAQQPSPLVVVIDQFEELWTLSSARAREQLLDGVAAVAVDADDTDVRIVVSIRADFFDRPLDHLTLGPIVGSNTWAVTPMSMTELHDAVTAPAAAFGISFEPGLAQSIVADVAGQPASLPLLQFTLAELFERRSDVITRAAYESIGGIAGAIATRAEQQYAALDEHGEDAARRLFLRLVVPGDGSEDTRRRARYGELAADAVAVAERFEDARLLVADRDVATREPTVEIAHESLLRSWPRLRGWLAEDRAFLHQLQHVGSAASEWSSAGRPESELYRGARLEAAENSMAVRPAQFSDVEREFVVAGRLATDAAERRQRRARRRLRVGFVATSVALAVALAAGAVAFVQRREADTQANAADVARLVSLSQSLTGTRRDLSLLLAVEAARRAPGAATTSALLGAVTSEPSFLGELRTGNEAAGVLVFGGDGQSLFANPRVPGAAPVRIDLGTGHVEQLSIAGLDADTSVRTFVPVDEHSALAVRADSGGGEHPVELVDIADGSVRGQSSFVGAGMNLALSPDRTRVAVITASAGGNRGGVVVIDASTLAVLASVDQPGPPATPGNYNEANHWSGEAAWIDDQHLVIGSPSGRLLVWDVDSGLPGLRLNDPPLEDLGDAAVVRVSPDARTILVVSSNRSMMAYDASSGARRWSHPQTANREVAFDPHQSVVWAQEAGFGSSRLFAYDLTTGERLGRELNGQHGTVCGAASAPDSSSIALASCNEGTIARWALDGRTATDTSLQPAEWATATDLWSPDGRYVATFKVDDPATVEVVDTRDGTHIPATGVSASAINTPVFRSDGILQAVVDANHHVVEFDPETRRTRDTGVVLPAAGVTANVAVRANLAAYGLDDGKIVIVDTEQAQILRTIETDIGPVYGLGWNRAGLLLAAGQSEHVEEFDISTGAKLATLSTQAGTLVINLDGNLLATAAFDGTIRFFDAVTLAPDGDPLTGATAFITQMAFTRDGHTLLTSSLDSTLRLFDVDSRRQLGAGIPVTSWGSAISPDSNEIAITTERGVQRLAISRDRLIEAACRAAGRNLDAEEWDQYIGGRRSQLCPEWPVEAS